MLERAGATGTTVIELPIGQHVASIVAGQVDGAYTLEPTGTVGRMNGTTRVVEAGVVAKYILGDPMAPWHGGSASLTIGVHQEASRRHEEVHGGVPARASSSCAPSPTKRGNTSRATPPSRVRSRAKCRSRRTWPGTSSSRRDVAYFQKFFDLFTEKGIFEKKVVVADLLYKG